LELSCENVTVGTNGLNPQYDSAVARKVSEGPQLGSMMPRDASL